MNKSSFHLIMQPILPVFLLLSADFAFSQKTVDETLTYINGKLGKGRKAELKKGPELVISFFKDEELIREDKVYLQDLDPSLIDYSKEEKALVLRCSKEAPSKIARKNEGKCIYRMIPEKRIKDLYHRVAIETDEKTAQKLKHAFAYLIKKSQDPEHVTNFKFD